MYVQYVARLAASPPCNPPGKPAPATSSASCLNRERPEAQLRRRWLLLSVYPVLLLEVSKLLLFLLLQRTARPREAAAPR